MLKLQERSAAMPQPPGDLNVVPEALLGPHIAGLEGLPPSPQTPFSGSVDGFNGYQLLVYQVTTTSAKSHERQY